MRCRWLILLLLSIWRYLDFKIVLPQQPAAAAGDGSCASGSATASSSAALAAGAEAGDSPSTGDGLEKIRVAVDASPLPAAGFSNNV